MSLIGILLSYWRSIGLHALVTGKNEEIKKGSSTLGEKQKAWHELISEEQEEEIDRTADIYKASQILKVFVSIGDLAGPEDLNHVALATRVLPLLPPSPERNAAIKRARECAKEIFVKRVKK